MKQPTDTLNGLIKINNERINRYRDATMKLSKPAGHYSDADLALLNSFAGYIKQSIQAKAEIKSLIAESGGQAEDNYENISIINEALTVIKELLNNSGRMAVLEECLSTEEVTQAAYEKALKNDRLTAFMGETLSKQKNNLQTAYRQIQIETKELAIKITH